MRLRRKVPQDAPPTASPAPAAEPVTRPDDLSVDADGKRLGELFVAAGLASVEQVVAALTQARDGAAVRLGQLLVDAGAVSERDLAGTLAGQYSLETVDLREVTPEPAATGLMPESTARALTAIPLSVEGDTVTVAVASPAETTLSALRAAVGRPLVIRVAARSDVVRTIDNTYRVLTGIGSRVEEYEARDLVRKDATRVDAGLDLQGEHFPVHFVNDATRFNFGPDITPGRDQLPFSAHWQGWLLVPSEGWRRFAIEAGSVGPVVMSRIKVLAGMNIVERRRPQDGQMSMDVEDRAVDIRVSTTAVIGGEKVVLRLLDKSRPLYRLAQLGMPADMSARYSAMLRSPYGMVICAGPTGSGKTTTLYGSLGEINSPERNIMTIEDPVEYTFDSINQIQINEQAGITFAGGLKSILRQDPDVILVGEIRDVETARIAVQSALTGHFVLSSLHATDAASALHRLLDMGIEAFLVASSVTAVLSQRLVRRICGRCRVRYHPGPEELSFLDSIGGRVPPEGFVRSAGCNFCAHTGYLDRIGVFELLPVTDTVRDLVLERGSREDIRKAARHEGMRSMQDEAARLVETGVTTAAEVLRAIYVIGG